ASAVALEDASTTKKGIVQLSSATNSTSETLAATPKAVKTAYDNAEKRLQKDQNGADIPGKDTFTKNIGACRAFGGSVSTTTGNWTTAQFIEWLDSQGAFNHPYWMCKGSWSYGNNKIITDTDCGNIHLAGAVIEVMGIKSAMTIRITTPTTSSGGGTTNAQFTYINHGTDYSPGWRRDYNSRNKPTASEIGALPSGGTAVSSVNLASKGRVAAGMVRQFKPDPVGVTDTRDPVLAVALKRDAVAGGVTHPAQHIHPVVGVVCQVSYQVGLTEFQLPPCH
ncbi:phage tail protein, partial [Escherichia coli]|nr:phage tail protein [Escherichia coli]